VHFDVQFNSATTAWPEMREAVLAAEEAGYGVAWVLDHLSGQVMKGPSMMECFILTGALAASTTSIGIGTLVANVWNRSLAVLADAAATAQAITGGRFWLGIGAGASPSSPFGAEHAAAGIILDPSLAVRHQRVLDFLAMAGEMWKDGVYNGVTGFPVPSEPIPIIVGVNSVSLAKLAAAGTDGINIRSGHPRLEAIIDAAREARPEHLPPLLVTTWIEYSEAIADPDSVERRRFARLGIDRLVVVQFGRVDLKKIHPLS
jgi:alkanesulfonate monooxygenase SsuD/methylene tetrahydromethanopterin reductase-like flavin-dependent oxidoreductase (luciferase family)